MLSRKMLLVWCCCFMLSVANAMPTPEYLSVPHWQACAAKKKEGSAFFVCLPQHRPSHCLKRSWKRLKENNLIPAC